MLDNIFSAFTAVFGVIGLIAFVYFVMLMLVRPAKNEKYYEIVVFGTNEADPCRRISFLLSRLAVTGNTGNCTILAVDNGLLPYQRKSLADAFGNEKYLVICTPEEAKKILFGG